MSWKKRLGGKIFLFSRNDKKPTLTFEGRVPEAQRREGESHALQITLSSIDKLDREKNLKLVED